MNFEKGTTLFYVCILFFSLFAQDNKNTRLQVYRRVNDLLSRMSLDEKIVQLQTMHAGRSRLDKDLFNNLARLDSAGENEQFAREAWGPNHFGDMADLNLQSQQEELVKAIHETGKPYFVVYLSHARPLTINWIAENSPAIVDAWFAGQEAGTAFANILFGDVNPSGKLTITYQRSVGQLPVYYNLKPSAQYFQYVKEANTSLYPFGYGLSYTNFSYSPLSLSTNSIGKNNSAKISVEITNTGRITGDEIVQLYIHRKTSSATSPVKELKAFRKITLLPGEAQTVSFSITPEMLKYWTADMQFEIEPGTVEIMVGRNSVDVQKVELAVK